MNRITKRTAALLLALTLIALAGCGENANQTNPENTGRAGSENTDQTNTENTNETSVENTDQTNTENTGETNAENTEQADAAEIARDAYEYALPLVLMELSQKAMTNVSERGGAPVNQFTHTTEIVAAGNRAVVRPNIDTLYSTVWLDLSSEPIIFSKPETDIYCSMVIYDAYTNCAAVLGTGGIDDGAEAVYAFCGPDFNGDIPEEITKISVPTNMAMMIVRSEYMNNIPELIELQGQLSLLPLSALDTVYTPPEGSFNEDDVYVPMLKLRGMDIETFFNTFNALAYMYPGTDADAQALARFAEIGIGPGLTFSLSDFTEDTQELMKNNIAATFTVLAAPDENTAYYQNINNWLYMADHVARFGTDYAFRASVAITTLFANPIEVTVYPEAAVDSSSNPLNGANNYVIRFAPNELPPCDGFWSITLYDDDWYLVDNPLNKYAIRGSDEFIENADGSIDIYLQQEPHDHLANWLPTPADGFKLSMRLYLPAESVLDKSWKPPFIELNEEG